MADRFRTSWFKASIGTKEVPSGVFGNKTKPQYDHTRVDIGEFSKLLAEQYNAFDDVGYDVVNVVPITMGDYDVVSQVGDGLTASYSVTRGADIVGKRRG